MSNSSLGNKKKESLSSVFSIRIKSSQKELLNKNPWIKREIEDYIRTHLDGFSN
ncbi:MAG: hypothetical protein Q4B63_03445 [Clostridium perfringens]|nr:hypothetical protein [Clostridium perfringens]